MVVPVSLVMEDVVLLVDDGKQLSVRSDLAPGESPGVQDLGHPLCHFSTQQHYSMEKQACVSGKEKIESASISHMDTGKDACEHKIWIQELTGLNFRQFRPWCCLSLL